MTNTTKKREEDDVDGFLNDTGSSNYGTYLQSGGEKGWRKKGKIDVWMMKSPLPKKLWQHSFHEIRARQDKRTRSISKEVWGTTFVCHEDEVVLKDRRRDDEGNRLSPFVRCPFCKLIEATRTLVRQGKLDWLEPIFEFHGDDKRRDVVIHSAGIYNGYRDVEKGTPESKALNDAGVYVKESWKENALVTLKYVFLVVSNDSPSGVLIATEAESLGKAVQKMVRKERMSDDVKGNPWVSPYCVRWIYDDAAVKWDEKYDATPMRNIELTDKIRKLIEGPAPNISHVLAQGDAKTLRARMEAHATKAFRKLVDWDAIFDVPEDEKTETSKPASAPASSKKSTIPCDDCGAEMDPKATKCPKCGVEYEPDDEDDDAPASEPEPKKPAPKQSKPAQKKAPPPPKVEEEEEEDDDDGDSDDLPF